jgi:flagellar basal-body rod protein FlgB
MSLLDQLFDTLSKTIHTNLDIRLQRHNLITGNIVNTDTPNYVPVDMDFEGTLQAVSQGEVGFAVPRPRTFYDATQVPGPDGNAVDIDYEMTRLALNQGAYQSSSVTLNKRLSLLRYAIMEGRSG